MAEQKKGVSKPVEEGAEELTPLKETYLTKYGDDPNADTVLKDLEASSNPLAFVRRVDCNGMNLLHYLGENDVDNHNDTAALAQRLVEIDPKLAQMIDKDGHLPLRHYGDHLLDCSDNWTTLKETISFDPPHTSHMEALEYVLPAFPEAIFAAEFVGELVINLVYKHVNLQNLPNDDNGEEEEEDDEDKEEERGHAEALIGLLKLTFTDGIHHIPTPESVLETGKRAPFHILCSYAYEPVFESLFDLFFDANDKASLPDVAANGILPLHLVLRSPTLRHPLKDGPIYGFCKMKQHNKSVPLGPIKKLVEAHPEAVVTPDENGCLPLHLAVRHNNLDLVQYLLQLRPESITALDHQGRSPLRMACQHNCDLDLIYFLVGANPTPTQWLRGLSITGHPDHTREIAPPRVSTIANQTIKHRIQFTATTLEEDESAGMAPVTWSVQTLLAWNVSKDITSGERKLTPNEEGVKWHLPSISQTTGEFDFSSYHPIVIRVRVTAENVAGWSSVEFEIAAAGYHN